MTPMYTAPRMTPMAIGWTRPASAGNSEPLYSAMTIATAAAVPQVDSQSQILRLQAKDDKFTRTTDVDYPLADQQARIEAVPVEYRRIVVVSNALDRTAAQLESKIARDRLNLG